MYAHGWPSDNTNSRKYKVTDAVGEFHPDINDDTSGMVADMDVFFRFLLLDGHLLWTSRESKRGDSIKGLGSYRGVPPRHGPSGVLTARGPLCAYAGERHSSARPD
jgi:hypothetical protein